MCWLKKIKIALMEVLKISKKKVETKFEDDNANQVILHGKQQNTAILVQVHDTKSSKFLKKS